MMFQEQKRFGKLLAEVGSELLATISESLSDNEEWTEATYEVRFSKDGAVSIRMFRVKLIRNTVKRFRSPISIQDQLNELWKLRDKCLVQGWYGIKFVLRPGGECEVEYNHDEACVYEDF